MIVCNRKSCGQLASWVTREGRFRRTALCDWHGAQIADSDPLDPIEVIWTERQIRLHAREAWKEGAA
jgi:hypothetical protein